ncbi:unnamed protein product [Arctia plantaginis]|uniref:Uncharacterized protein n=1 Tax=Arctia plantaginis TaxID=874455 RepID=A0A8S1B8K7_ARCPL|nr:unnamed protein product [Arctia plantaginis]
MVLNIFITICYIVIFAFPLARSRKYDIEEESMRLYGEDSTSVLHRFRRTAEYLKILSDRNQAMNAHLEEIGVQTMQYIENKLARKVADSVGYTKENMTPTPTTPALGFRHKARRDDDSEETTEDPIQKLDSYHHLHRVISTKDRNHFRDIGFEMAGQMVDLIIKGMGPVAPRNAHEAANPRDPKTPSSIHDHEVHSTLGLSETVPTETTTAAVDAFRFKNKRIKF